MTLVSDGLMLSVPKSLSQPTSPEGTGEEAALTGDQLQDSGLRLGARGTRHKEGRGVGAEPWKTTVGGQALTEPLRPGFPHCQPAAVHCRRAVARLSPSPVTPVSSLERASTQTLWGEEADAFPCWKPHGCISKPSRNDI